MPKRTLVVDSDSLNFNMRVEHDRAFGSPQPGDTVTTTIGQEGSRSGGGDGGAVEKLPIEGSGGGLGEDPDIGTRDDRRED